jgi:hypothetical protein
MSQNFKTMVQTTSNLRIEVQQKDVISTCDVLIPPPNIGVNYHQFENEMCAQDESSTRTLISDTRACFRWIVSLESERTQLST